MLNWDTVYVAGVCVSTWIMCVIRGCLGGELCCVLQPQNLTSIPSFTYPKLTGFFFYFLELLKCLSIVF